MVKKTVVHDARPFRLCILDKVHLTCNIYIMHVLFVHLVCTYMIYCIALILRLLICEV